MSTRILKATCNFVAGEWGTARFALPSGAIPIKFGFQHDSPTVWFTWAGDIDDWTAGFDPTEWHEWEIVATGEPVPHGHDYVETVILNAWVWHIFKRRAA